MAKKKGRRSAAADWQTVIYETATGDRPAVEYLTDEAMPDTVRRELLVTIAAVTTMGPPRFPTSTPRWSIMRKDKTKGAGSVDMSGICEARDKHAKLLYRLFCIIDRDAPDHGLAAPSLVLLSGTTKPDNTAVPISEYQLVDRYRNDYRATHRIAKNAEESAFWPDFSDWKS
jgi:hypothetical protein